MVDRFGLLTDGMPNLLPFQTKLVQKRENLKNWDTDNEVLSAGRSAQREAGYPDWRLRSDGAVHRRDHS